ncbi:MAG: hypothetical protein KAS67_05390 [Thermoplasmata archaeon]|nr:hypothetical protein [Thermoplasmata archaeon]
MAAKSKPEKLSKKEKLEKGYIECYYCDKLVKPKALKCPHCGKWYSSGKQVLVVLLAVILILSVFSFYVMMPDQDPYNDPPPDDDDDNGDDEPEYDHLVSAADNDFWVMKPLMHPDTGAPHYHPPWINITLVDKPILMFVRDNATLLSQRTACENINLKYSENITYIDLVLGIDEPRASEVLTNYDPTGDPIMAPLTIIVSKSQNNNSIWHSWEGTLAESVLDEWMEEAIRHHDSAYG